jgi:hypothetical protein
MLKHIFLPLRLDLRLIQLLIQRLFSSVVFLLLASFPTKFSDRPLWYFGSPLSSSLHNDVGHSPHQPLRVAVLGPTNLAVVFNFSQTGYPGLPFCLLDFAILHTDYISVCQLIAQFVGASDIGSVLYILS